MFEARNIVGRLASDLDSPEVQKQASGAWLLGPLPSVGVRAFLHVVFDGIPSTEIESLTLTEKVVLPAAYREFLVGCNGLILYQGALSIYGYCREISRDPGRRMPFDFRERNLVSRPPGSSSRQFFIGSFNWDGSLLYLEGDRNAVRRRAGESNEVIGEWASIEELLDKEIARISKLFDRGGNEIDTAQPTSPSL